MKMYVFCIPCQMSKNHCEPLMWSLLAFSIFYSSINSESWIAHHIKVLTISPSLIGYQLWALMISSSYSVNWPIASSGSQLTLITRTWNPLNIVTRSSTSLPSIVTEKKTVGYTKVNLNIPILPEAFLTFASKSSIGPSYMQHMDCCGQPWVWHMSEILNPNEKTQKPAQTWKSLHPWSTEVSCLGNHWGKW